MDALDVVEKGVLSEDMVYMFAGSASGRLPLNLDLKNIHR